MITPLALIFFSLIFVPFPLNLLISSPFCHLPGIFPLNPRPSPFLKTYQGDPSNTCTHKRHGGTSLPPFTTLGQWRINTRPLFRRGAQGDVGPGPIIRERQRIEGRNASRDSKPRFPLLAEAKTSPRRVPGRRTADRC